MKRMTQILLLVMTVLICACERPHPQVTLYPLDAQPIKMESLQGKWVVINYWATWCKPCREEIPAFNEISQQFSDKQVAIFAVNYDQLPKKQLPALVKLMKIRYASLTKDPAQDLGLGDIPGLPATFVFSPQGKLVKRLLGRQTKTSLLKVIDLKETVTT